MIKSLLPINPLSGPAVAGQRPETGHANSNYVELTPQQSGKNERPHLHATGQHSLLQVTVLIGEEGHKLARRDDLPADTHANSPQLPLSP